MRLAIMQPYLFPYAGYFRLVGAVDRFVFYDDVNFIKGGWINRNRLFLAGDIRYFTIPLDNPSPFRKIGDIDVAPRERWRHAMRESIRHAYGKAPHYAAAMAIFDEATATGGIAQVARRSVMLTCEYLGLRPAFVESSAIYANQDLNGPARVIDICRREGADVYINAPGGKALYDPAQFAAVGIDLRFVSGAPPAYSRGSQPPVPGLSILDMLMFHSPDEIRPLLAEPHA